MANLLITEPFLGGSHAAWANGYAQHSSHEVEIMGLKDSFWKWRMHGGAITLAKKYLQEGLKPDAIIVSDMLDLTTFLALTREQTANTPVYLYFHENQLT